MLLYAFFHSIEFFVIATVIAAAIITRSAQPHGKREVRSYLYGGTLLDDGPSAEAETPGIILTVSEDGRNLQIERRGLTGISYDDGAYAVAVDVSGFDVTIEERLTFGSRQGTPATGAQVNLDCLVPERYHFLYRSTVFGRNCAFSMTLKPGAQIGRALE